MFVDHATIHCIAGRGGNGCNSYIKSRHLKHPKPTGGDGGDGGAVIIRASSQVHTLLDVQMKKTFKAQAGAHGGRNNMNGAVGDSTILDVPVGTEAYDDKENLLLADLCKDKDSVIAVFGGAGGRGNDKKTEASMGIEGQERMVRLELKLIADVGLIGFPNAGKSTLISHVSSAKSRIAAFPFTTKQPVLGVVKTAYGDPLVIADIPGLIEGASQGRGLGHQFLRHVERTKMFVHMIDMAAVDGRDPVEDYRVIRKELESYSSEFIDKPAIVAANKMDVPEAEENLVKFKKVIKDEVYPISAATGKGIPELIQGIFKVFKLDE